MATSPPRLSIVLLLLCTTIQSWAEVTPAEQRLSAELSAAIVEGNVVKLGDPKQPFLAIFTEAQAKKARGGIILLHDLNTHADWQDVISPLRQSLPHYGWHTLSIQLPALPENTQAITAADQSALEQEINRRIQAAIEYCRNQRIFNIVLLGHQFGAVMASRFAANPSNTPSINALVAINLYSPGTRAWINTDAVRNIAVKVNTAFLDIVPDQSPEYVLELARNRKSAMTKLGHDKYKQIHIIGTDYTFRGAETTLVSRIQGWLTKLAPSMEVQFVPEAAN